MSQGQLRHAAQPDYSHYDIRERPAAQANQAAAKRSSDALPSRLAAAEHSSGAIYSLRGPLTSPAAGDPVDVARRYLDGLRPRPSTALAVDAPGVGPPELVLVGRSRSPRMGLTHLTFQPAYQGIPFFEEEVQAHIDDWGQIWRLSRAPLLPAIPHDTQPKLSGVEAVETVLETLLRRPPVSVTVAVPPQGPAQAATVLAPELSTPARVSLVWFPVEKGMLPAWQMYMDFGRGGAYWVVVDALEGRLLFSRSLLHYDRPEGLVFRAPGRASPIKGSQTVEPFAGWPASHGDCPAEIYPAQFRSGSEHRCWVEGQQTFGNNADVCLDADGDNLCDRRASAAQDRFAFAFNNSFDRDNDASADSDAALANAFYWINVLHDWLYRLGFDEAAGNFQADNFGRGGAAGDAVRVDLQDAVAVNNATFTAAPDGIAPRMELGLFTGLRRDTAFDGDIVTHEYVHGLTTRLIGGPASANALSLWQSGAMGEGWSDAYAASFTGDAVIGEYSSRNPATGIRTVAYDNSPYTFGMFGTLRPTVIPNSGGLLLGLPQVHRDGEIWATVLWELRQMLGRDDFEQLITAALNLTPQRPSMLDARDAILQAAQAGVIGGENACAVWAAFAARGFGFSAALNPIQAGQANDTALSVFESFDVPAVCGGSPPLPGSLLLEEGAESSQTSWTPSGQWHRTSRRSATGSFSWWYGQETAGTYDNGARNRGSLTSPPIDLRDAQGAVIEWEQFLRTEGFNQPMDLAGAFGPYLNADSGRLMVSPDGGSSWWVVTHLAHPTPGDGFVPYRVNLSRYIGQPIRLRFDFDTFDSQDNSHEGWYLDNIRVSRLGAEPARLAADPPMLSFGAPAGGPAPAAQNINVSSHTGAETLTWTATVTKGSAWLSIFPASGVTPSKAQVAVATLGLPPGLHVGEIRFEALNQPELAVRVPVTAAVEAAGPIARWPFEEEGGGSGVPLVDVSVRSHNGVTAGPGTRTVAGVEGMGRLFDGVSAYAAFPASEDFARRSMTLRTWVKIESYPPAVGIIASALDPATLQGWLLGVLESGNVVLMARGSAGESLWLISRRELIPGKWHSVAFSLGEPAGTVGQSIAQAALYLDGEPEAAAEFDGYGEGAVPLTIGRASWWDGYYLRFAIDEMQLDPVVWPASQARADFARFSPPAAEPAPTPVAEWNFEEPPAEAANVLDDSSGRGHHAILQGSASTVVGGIAGSAFRFGGPAPYATVATHSDFASPSFTYSGWIRLDAYPRQWGVVFSNFDGAHRGWFLGVNSDGRVIVSIWGQPSSSSWVLSERRLETGHWSHLAVTFDDLSQQAVLYIDGKADRSFQTKFTPQASEPLTFARASWFDGYYLGCALDELRVFATALPTHEIRQEFERFQPAAAAASGDALPLRLDRGRGGR